MQKIREGKRRPNKMGEMSMFSGIVHCADCGQKMYLCRCTTSNQKEYFNCSTYRKKKKKCCTSHQITVEAVEKLVLNDLQQVLSFAKEKETHFLELLKANSAKQTVKAVAADAQELENAERRVFSLDKIIQSLYEDKVTGKLTDERFCKLSGAYEDEQATLKKRILQLKAELNKTKSEADNISRFMRLIRKYTELSELTPEILREFIDRIIIHQSRVNGQKVQTIEIIYNCVGAIALKTTEKAA